MTPAPAVTVTSGSSAPSLSPPTDTGVWFIVAISEKGPSDEVLSVKNVASGVTHYGERDTGGYLYDSLQTFFKEGGYEAQVARVVGPSAKKATVTAKNGAAENTLEITATSEGAWANDIDVVIEVSGGNFTLDVKLDGVVVEESPTLATNAEAVTWAESSSYIRLKDLGKGDPAAATKELASGTDDRENITEEEWLDAINLFSVDLGPGQVSMPGRTTKTAQENLLEHARVNNRVALLDGTDTATVGTLVSQSEALRESDDARYGGLFAPWPVIPGLTTGTTRTAPPCALQAGLTARSDALNDNPNLAIAGTDRGVARYATDLSQAGWSADERTELSEAGVNVIRVIQGAVVTFDDLTLADPLVDTTWELLSNARCNMAIQSGAYTVGLRHLFAQLDGRGLETAAFGGDLTAEVFLPLFDKGALFGETPADAFTVKTDSQVNTEETLSEGKLKATCVIDLSASARNVEIEINVEAI